MMKPRKKKKQGGEGCSWGSSRQASRRSLQTAELSRSVRRASPAYPIRQRAAVTPGSFSQGACAAARAAPGTQRRLGCRGASARARHRRRRGPPPRRLRGTSGLGTSGCGRGLGRHSSVGLLPGLAQTNAPPSPGSSEPPPPPPPKFPEGLRLAEGCSQRGGPLTAAADRSSRPACPPLAAAWLRPGTPSAPPCPTPHRRACNCQVLFFSCIRFFNSASL